MRREPLDEADPLAHLADEVEAGEGPVELVRPGHRPVVLVSAEDWAEMVSIEETAWWRRSAAERSATGEPVGDGEDGPGLDEAGIRREFGHLLPHDGAA
jgi:prevent-host-death family protein